MGDQESATRRTITPAQRIKELNVIDKDITGLVQAAGLAIKALTTSPSPSEDKEEDSSDVTVDVQKTAFQSSTATYFRLLDSISVRLRRQIYALEEAEIIPHELPAKEIGSVNARSGAAAIGGSDRAVGAAIGGLGNLDLAWLNSRNDAVGRDMEAQIWAQTRSFVQDAERLRTSQSTNGHEAVEAEGDAMEIDTRQD
ncbi:MAG: hypothetical protein M1816_008110 [Peltula sp. TS41687]|nr:MAG: hypothetical protein M1816_008110 [Peltula sp. TS41687]